MYACDSGESGLSAGAGAARGKSILNVEGGYIEPMVYTLRARAEAADTFAKVLKPSCTAVEAVADDVRGRERVDL